MAQDGLKGTWTGVLGDVDTVAAEELGTLRFEGGKWYKYVEYVSGTLPDSEVALNFVAYVSYPLNTVTCDLSDAITANGGIPAGQLVAIPVDGSYLWIQIKGISGIFPTNFIAGSIGNAMSVIGASTDGTLDVSGAVTDAIAGKAYNVTGSACTAVLDCPF